MGRNEKREGGQHENGQRGRERPGLADDELYRALSSQLRRRLLYYLLDAEESTVDELAEVLLGWETTEKGGMATAEDHKQLVASLCHAHLPALADAGFIQYDNAVGAVTLTELDDEVSELLERSIAAEMD